MMTMSSWLWQRSIELREALDGDVADGNTDSNGELVGTHMGTDECASDCQPVGFSAPLLRMS